MPGWPAFKRQKLSWQATGGMGDVKGRVKNKKDA